MKLKIIYITNIRHGSGSKFPTLYNKLNIFSKQYLQEGNSRFVSLIPFLATGCIAVYMDAVGMNVSFSKMQEDFGTDLATTQWVNTIYLLSTAAFSIPLSKIAVRTGEKNMLIVCSTICIVLQIALCFIYNFWAFVVLKFVVGAVHSSLTTIRTALLRKMAAHDKSQQFLQMNTITLNIVCIFVPFANGVMADYNWRMIMLVTSTFAFLNMLTLLQFPPLKGVKSDIKFDVWGVVLLFFGVGLLDLSFTILAMEEYIVFGAMLVVSLVLLFWFYKVEAKHKDPILPIKIMRNPILEYSITNMLFMFAMKGTEYIFPQLFAFYEKDSSSLGLIQTLNMILGILVAIFQPAVQKRVINKTILVTALMGQFVIVFAMIVFANSFMALIVLNVVHTLFMAFAMNIIFQVTLLAAPRECAHQISAIPITTRTVSQGISLCVSSMILQSFNAGSDTRVYANACRTVYAMVCAMLLACVILILTRTGQARSEMAKKGFRTDKVKELKLVKEREIEMM